MKLVCPVCGTQLQEGMMSCPQCGWVVTQSLSHQDYQQQTEAWARQIWSHWRELISNLSKIERLIQDNKSLPSDLSYSTLPSSELMRAIPSTSSELQALMAKQVQEQIATEIKIVAQIIRQDLKAELAQEISHQLQLIKTQLLEAGLQTPQANKLAPSPQLDWDTPSVERVEHSNQPEAPQPHLTQAEQELVQIYNQNRQDFANNLVVSETKESVEERRTGTKKTVMLEANSRGSYWLVFHQGVTHLVPTDRIKINEYNLGTVKAIFECHGCQAGITQGFQLLKPAKVVKASSVDIWEVTETGILQFE